MLLEIGSEPYREKERTTNETAFQNSDGRDGAWHDE